MKTIRFFIIFLWSIVTLTASAQSNDYKYTVEDVKIIVNTLNKDCPQVIEEDMILTSVIYKDSSIFYNYEVEYTDETLIELGSHKSELVSLFLNELKNNDCIDILKDTKTNLIIVFSNKSGGKLECPMSYEDM